MAIDAETYRLMENWARWRIVGGGLDGMPLSGAYALEAPGRREEVSIPLLNGEAIDVDHVVRELLPELKTVVHEYWCRVGGDAVKARKCGCSLSTFRRRLDEAHSRIRVCLDEKHARNRRTAEALRTRCLIRSPT